MSYAEQIRNPDAALNPQQPREQKQMSWWWWIVLLVVLNLVLIAIFKPEWLAKIGIYFGGSSGLGGINPHGWV